MFLLLLCYAFAGVVLFGTVKYGENINRWVYIYLFIHCQANFFSHEIMNKNPNGFCLLKMERGSDQLETEMK